MSAYRLPLILNGHDYSQDANKWGYSCSVVTRTGPNARQMQDGSKRPDNLAYKTRIVFQMNGLKADRRAALAADIMADFTVGTVYDANYDALREDVEWMCTLSAAPIPWYNTDGSVKYSKGLVLTMEER